MTARALFATGTAVLAGAGIAQAGYFRGHGTSGFGVAPHVDAPTPLRDGVAYFRPLIIMNYNSGNGTQECDFIRVERLTVPDDSDNTSKKRLVPDAEFSLSTGEDYWFMESSGGTAPSITLTGGLEGGYGTLVGDTNAKYFVSRRRPAFRGLQGETFTITVRWRRTGSLSGSGEAFSAHLIRHNQSPDSAGFDPESGTVNAGGVTLTVAEMNARTVNEWQEDTGVLVLGAAPSGNPPYTSLICGIGTPLTGGTLQLDHIDVIQGSNGLPHKRTYTSGATLTGADVMKDITYDSGSSGTLTLPAASVDYLGSRIYFEQAGTGQLTIAAPGGSSLFSPPNTTGNRALSGRYAKAFVECRGSGVWVLAGSLA